MYNLEYKRTIPDAERGFLENYLLNLYLQKMVLDKIFIGKCEVATTGLPGCCGTPRLL